LRMVLRDRMCSVSKIPLQAKGFYTNSFLVTIVVVLLNLHTPFFIESCYS
jgi:hypothetical protein